MDRTLKQYFTVALFVFQFTNFVILENSSGLGIARSGRVKIYIQSAGLSEILRGRSTGSYNLQ